MPVVIHDNREIGKIKEVAILAAEIRDTLAEYAVSGGFTTESLQDVALRKLHKAGACSAFYGYQGFPGHICVSINDEVAHGVAGHRKIKDGDIVSIDIGVKKDGFYADTAVTVCCGEKTEETEKLLHAGYEALMAGVAVAVPGNLVYDIGKAIQKVIVHTNFSLFADFVGHGCGSQLHEPPEVPNIPDAKQEKIELRPGMVLAIEPVVTSGQPKIYICNNGWTAKTVDSRPSVHFEELVLITKDKPEVLTRVQRNN